MSEEEDRARYRYLQLKAKAAGAQSSASDDSSDGSVDNRRWDQKLGDALQPLSDAGDNIAASIPYAMGAMEGPIAGMAGYAFNKVNEAAGSLAAPATELAGRSGVPGPGAAALGMGASIFANPTTYINPGGAGIAGKAFRPTVPPERAFGVATAEKYGMGDLLTRADRTGSQAWAQTEKALKSPFTGAGPFQKLQQLKDAALERAQETIGSRFGTDAPPSSTGYETHAGLHGELGAANNTAVDLYKNVTDAQMGTSLVEKALNETDYQSIPREAQATIADLRAQLSRHRSGTEATSPTPFSPQEAKTGDITRPSQSQYRVGPTSRDLPIMDQEASKNPVKTGDPYAVYQGNSDYGNGPSSQYILRGEHPRTGGNFTGDDLKKMGIKVKGRTQRSVDLKHEPVDAPDELFGDASASKTMGFQKLNEIRNRLSAEIAADTKRSPLLGDQVGPNGLALIPIKKALDADIAKYVEDSQKTPYGRMESNEFNTSFTKAKAFYGAYKNLRNNEVVNKLSEADPSQVSSTLFGTKSVEDINIARAATGEKGFAAAKKEYFNKLLGDPAARRAFEKKPDEFKNAVLNSEERNALREMDSLKDISNTSEILAGNPSKTGRALTGTAQLAMVGAGAAKMLVHPIAGALDILGNLVGPYVASKSYIGSAKGIPYSYGPTSMALTRGATAAQAAERKKSFVEEYIKRVVVGKQ